MSRTTASTRAALSSLRTGGGEVLQGLGERDARSRRRRRDGLGPAVGSRCRRRGEEPDERAAARRPDAVVHPEQPEPGQLVMGVVEQPNGRDKVFDVRRLDETQPAVLPVGDAPRRELELDEIAVVGCPDEHGLITQPQALLMSIEDPVDDGAGFGGGVVAPHEDGPARGRSLRAEHEARARVLGRRRFARCKMG